MRVYHEKQNVVTCFETIDEDDLDFLYRCNTFIYKEQKESEKNLENYYIKLEFTYF